MIWSQTHNHAQRPRFDPGRPPLPIKILANWIGEDGLLSSAIVTISRYSRSMALREAWQWRTWRSISHASSLRPMEAGYPGLSGSILMKTARNNAGMHWKPSKNRQRTTGHPLLMTASPNDSQEAMDIPRSVHFQYKWTLARRREIFEQNLQLAMKTYPRNPPRWAADDVSDTRTDVMPVRAFYHQHTTTYLEGDQDHTNLQCAYQWRLLPPIWN